MMWKDCKSVGFSTFWTKLFTTCSRAAISAEWKGRLQCFDTPILHGLKGRVSLSWPFPSFAIFFSQDRPKGAHFLVSVHCLTGSFMLAHSFFHCFRLGQDRQWRAIFISKASINPEIRKKQAGRWRGIYPSDFAYRMKANAPRHCATKIRETLKDCENADEMCVEMM